MKTKTRLAEIAAAAGVSQTTASRVFTRHPYVSDDVRARVMKAAKELSYSPSSRHGKSSIGVVVESYENLALDSYVRLIFSTAAMEIARRGYSLELISNSEGAHIISPLVKGLISLIPSPRYRCALPEESPVPLVAINSRPSSECNEYVVNSNEVQGMNMIIEYLKGKGHRRVGMINYGQKHNYSNQMRLDAFLKAIRKFKMESEESFVRMVEYPENYVEQLGKILKSGISALICVGESIALETVYDLDLFGRKIPEDISLVSFECRNISCFHIPPHTTLSQNFEKLCSEALDVIENPAGRKRESLVDYSLIERESVKALAVF